MSVLLEKDKFPKLFAQQRKLISKKAD